MSTGPEHYREAEILLNHAANIPSNYDETSPAAALLFAQAQVHATLTLAAATAQTIPATGSGVRSPRGEWLDTFRGESTLDKLQRAVAELLHDVDTSADDQVHEVLERFRTGLPDTSHGEPVLALARQLMRAEGVAEAGESR